MGPFCHYEQPSKIFKGLICIFTKIEDCFVFFNEKRTNMS